MENVVAGANKTTNVLLLSIDDLRPELGCYGKEYIKSPNIDKLAAQGTLFLNHYPKVPTCGASGYSILTGQLPAEWLKIAQRFWKS